MTATAPTRTILAAAFATPDGAARAAAAVVGAAPEKIANTAVLHVKADGTPTFTETKDWGAGRGALVGGAIGLIGGPLGVLAGSGVGILASRLRDVGFKNSQLQELGETIQLGESAVVFEISSDAVSQATELLGSLSARQVVVEPVDADVSALFD
ncbi:DUF1269 domain-containing protein [Rathayibacter sp. VKM Ac-2857]|uniref:DUF1269 domain-containing protein n=1 Tax=Rathayibacter sp. VKM Ac-2857 TaxID=2739020 RepID=UPI0015673160|nr:DUF1269 domain-containing protein [Rathayibacter sp. VKM Ac-2857]NQX16636.1 DUF1269 domain-containing protein [Rathayibacter sp. VKM Ac-2857]